MELRRSNASAFSEARPEQCGAEQRWGARVRKSRQKEAAGAADAVLMQIEWSEAEGLKSAGAGTETEVEVVGSVGRRIDGGKWWDTGGEVGISSGAGRTGAERGEPCRVLEFSSCGEVISCCSCEQPWRRTELDLSCGKSFDDRHRSTTLGATPKWVGFLGGGFWFPGHRNRTQGSEAQRQEGGASAVGQKAEVTDTNESLGEQMQETMSGTKSPPSGSSLGKNSTVQSQSSSSCQNGSMQCCWFIPFSLFGSLLSRIPHRNSRYAHVCGVSIRHSYRLHSHYGLRYGSAPATGNFQRLRGRPPLVGPLQSCMGRSFTAVTRLFFKI